MPTAKRNYKTTGSIPPRKSKQQKHDQQIQRCSWIFDATAVSIDPNGVNAPFVTRDRHVHRFAAADELASLPRASIVTPFLASAARNQDPKGDDDEYKDVGDDEPEIISNTIRGTAL